MFDVILIGAGVVGSLIARKLSSYKLDVLVVEKENDVGNVTSMANSGIVHSGYDPKPNSNKAKFNVLGNKMYPQIAEELDVPLDKIGSLTLAFSDEDYKQLEFLVTRGKENGVKVKLLSREEVLKEEKNVNKNIVGALLAEDCYVVNPFTLCAHAMENAVDNGVKLHLDEEVIGIKKNGEYFIVKTNKGEYESKFIIDAAGVNSDYIHALIEEIDYKITPRKGEYFVLDHFQKGFVNHVIFPLPSEKGKGVLVVPTTSGNYLIGPSSELIEDKDDLSTDKMTLDEVRNSVNKMVDNIPFNQSIRVFSGVRPTPSNHDFNISYAKSDNHFIVVSGIESPGLASSPAIAEYVVDNLLNGVKKLEKKENYEPFIRKHRVLKDLSNEERNKIIKENPDYGTIVCSCEKISLGEIKDELSRSVPPRTVKAVKKRTRAGFGKCQGGFCQSKVIHLLADYYHVKMSDILLDKDESNICRYENKSEAKL